ncbi:hypothetical protein M426DRAFT_7845 [Hypoxylon sp. CI-4A]|nr:hypothetical protein M426DRAFT_7845 [Hypoxylon sp. CI-4A]
MSQLELGVHGITLVSQGTAYGLLIGLGVLFCAVILVAIRIQKAYLSEDSNTSEMFMVANRSVGVGLTASAVFSSWMWINETVFAATMCYRYGLAVPLFWATGLCFQIALMAVLGVLAKIRVPRAQTSLGIIRMRYGKIGHVVFIVLNLTNNVFGCASMILTGSQLIYGISGMHIVAATFLIPLGVVLYTAVGGLKATFLTDYLHTLVALVLIIYFTLSVLTHDAIGGLYGLYDKIIATASENYIEGNYQGSLLTMKSKNAIIWALLLKFGNLALVICDTAFWQKSFASEVSATVPGYNLAAVAIFGIPWGLGTVIGLAARAIHNTPIFPSYPDEFTMSQVNSGLTMPYTIKALIGDQGIVAFFVLLFMALTSTVSSSLIAVSSILSFDVYKSYINPKASDKKLLKVSHLTVVAHALFIVGISLALNYGGADMTWIGYFRPILSCPAIIPLAFSLMWSGQTRLAAILSPILGFFTGLAIWLGTAYSLYGDITLATTEEGAPALYGACGSFFSPALYSILISKFYHPYKFDWREFLRTELEDEYQTNPLESDESEGSSINDEKKIRDNKDDNKHPSPLDPVFLSREVQVLSSEDEDNAVRAHSRGTQEAKSGSDAEKTTQAPAIHLRKRKGSEIPLDEVRHPFSEETLRELYWWYKIAWVFFIFIVLVTFVAWPMPLYRNYIFTKSFFSGWVTVAIAWTFFSFFAVAVYPLYDGRHEIAKGVLGVWNATRDRFGRGEKA